MIKEIRIVEFGAELAAYAMIGGCCTGKMCPIICSH